MYYFHKVENNTFSILAKSNLIADWNYIDSVGTIFTENGPIILKDINSWKSEILSITGDIKLTEGWINSIGIYKELSTYTWPKMLRYPYLLSRNTIDNLKALEELTGFPPGNMLHAVLKFITSALDNGLVTKAEYIAIKAEIIDEL